MAGVKIRSFEKGAVTLTLTPKEELTQMMGFVHAGVVTGLADHAAGAAYASALPDDRICVTIELKINFLKPALGETLAAEASIISQSGKIGVLQSNIYCETTGKDRVLCATAIVTLRSVALERRTS